MIRFLKVIIVLVTFSGLGNCSRVLQTLELQVNTRDVKKQEQFNVLEKTLTLSEAREQSLAPYERFVIQNTRGIISQTVLEDIALESKFPASNNLTTYKIGKNDSLSFSRLIDNNISKAENNSSWPIETKRQDYKLGIGDQVALLQIVEQTSELNSVSTNDGGSALAYTPTEVIQKVIEAKGRVGSDGSVLLLEVGRLNAAGKTLNQLRSEVRNILIRNGASPRFQLEISEFRSQRAYLTVVTEESEAKIIMLNDQETDLRDILASAGIGLKPGVTTLIKLKRKNKTYGMKLREVFRKNDQKLTINDRDHIFVEDISSRTISSEAIVGEDGSVVLAGVGKIQVEGLTISEIQKKIGQKIEKIPNSENAFQIEVSKFGSQSALVNIPGKPGGVIKLTSTGVRLDEILTQNGLSLDPNIITRVNLQRNSRTYSFTLDDLMKHTSKKVFLEPQDRVTIESLSYKSNKVFIVGGVTPKIVKIDKKQRETLADILFTDGGVLASSNANRSDVYLLRGTHPVVAYHLDAQNPTRLIVADAMELRPNDILYVAEQPIVSFNRTLATIAPLRILLSDIQDNNIP